MTDADLRHRADLMLVAAVARVIDWPDSSPLRRTVMGGRDRLNRAMRVALAGQVKAGKSTLVNALLGQRLVATGAVETTFNINWLSYGDVPSIEVDFKAGAARPLDVRRFATAEELVAELETLTRRGSGDPSVLGSIRHVRVRFPHPLLRIFEIIDTPGLESVFKVDAANTEAFLAMRDRERTTVTRTESSAADAVLYLFKRNFGATDLRLLGGLHDPALAGSNPMNTLGALTLADTYWPAEDDPLAAARSIVHNRYADLPQIGRTFHTVLPVAAECAIGAATLTQDEAATLRTLAEVARDRLLYALRSHKRFRDREDPDLPDRAARRAVWDRLGPWGVWKACELVREGVSDRAVLAIRLEEASGVSELRRILATHFGRRAQLLQVHRVCQEVIYACGQEKAGPDATRRAFADKLAAEFERLYLEEPVFDELRLLGRLHEGRLALTDEERQDILAVFGEGRQTDAARLRAPEETGCEQLIDIATRKQRYWHVRAGDPLSGDPTYRDAARVLAGFFGMILIRLLKKNSRP